MKSRQRKRSIRRLLGFSCICKIRSETSGTIGYTELTNPNTDQCSLQFGLSLKTRRRRIGSFLLNRFIWEPRKPTKMNRRETA